jgi:hypothetical protein
MDGVVAGELGGDKDVVKGVEDGDVEGSINC